MKYKDGRSIPAEDVKRVNLARVPRGFTQRATSWFLDKYKLSVPITPELFKSRKRSAWNKIRVFTDDVYRVSKKLSNRRSKKRSTQQASTRKTYGEKANLKSKPRWGLHGIGPAIRTREQKDKLWLDLDKKYDRRFRDASGRTSGDAPEKDSWKSEQYEKATGQKWGDPTAPSAVTDKDLIDLLKKVGLEIEKESRTKVVDAINMYLSTKKDLNEWPRTSQVATALIQLKEIASSFDRTLKELDFVSRSSLREHSERIDIEKVRAQARMVAEGCTDALKSIPFDKGGRPRNLAIDALLNDMSRAFEESTGKPTTITWNQHSGNFQGDFFDLVFACLKKVDPASIWSNQSLGEKIKRMRRRAK
jgi:hypothetical protein